ncbi:MAG: hypothetical protein RIT28_3003 [Pseudomonadota bacterium]
MLRALETRLIPAVQAALGAESGLTVQQGPALPPTAAGAKLVTLWARSLTLDPPEGDDPTSGRGDARLSATLTRTPSDGGKDLRLTSSAGLTLTEVESPAGVLRQPGDDYLTEQHVPSGDWVVRFYQAQTGAARVTLTGDAARGFTDRRRGRVELSLTAWATSLADADRLAGRALAALLPAVDALGVVDADELSFRTSLPPNAGTRLRLSRAVALLEGAARAVERQGSAGVALYSSQVTLSVRGAIELTVAYGSPEPQGVIEGVRLDADVLGATGPGPRIIEARPLVDLRSVTPTLAARAVSAFGVNTFAELLLVPLAELERGDPSLSSTERAKIITARDEVAEILGVYVNHKRLGPLLTQSIDTLAGQSAASLLAAAGGDPTLSAEIDALRVDLGRLAALLDTAAAKSVKLGDLARRA